MSNRSNTALLEWTAILSVLASVLVLIFQLVGYSRVRSRLQPGMIIAEVPVGGLTAEEARTVLSQVYSAPVELHYREAVFLLDPAAISFRLDLESMLARADTHRTQTSFWEGFWNYLWRQPGRLVSASLAAEYSESQLRSYLEDVAARYDAPPTDPIGDAGTMGFVEGLPGHSIDIASSMAVIDLALRVPSNRRAALTIVEGTAPPPSLDTLGELILNYVDQAGYDGLVSLVVIDLQTGEELAINPEVAYAGMSIMKIPILVDTYRVWDVEPFGDTLKMIVQSIEQSDNFSANVLLFDLGNGSSTRGAEVLTEDLWELGLTNTFMAGYYDQEDPPRTSIKTVANQRTDLNTQPDPYMQTTPGDMAALLAMIYQCAEFGGGAFSVVYPGQITERECQTILDVLSRNKIGTLIEAGVPEGTRVAHKHGFSRGDTYGDAGVVFSPGGNYVIVMYLWRPNVLEWEQAGPVMAGISQAVYNYFNP